MCCFLMQKSNITTRWAPDPVINGVVTPRSRVKQNQLNPFIFGHLQGHHNSIYNERVGPPCNKLDQYILWMVLKPPSSPPNSSNNEVKKINLNQNLLEPSTPPKTNELAPEELHPKGNPEIPDVETIYF